MQWKSGGWLENLLTLWRVVNPPKKFFPLPSFRILATQALFFSERRLEDTFLERLNPSKDPWILTFRSLRRSHLHRLSTWIFSALLLNVKAQTSGFGPKRGMVCRHTLLPHATGKLVRIYLRLRITDSTTVIPEERGTHKESSFPSGGTFPGPTRGKRAQGEGSGLPGGRHRRLEFRAADVRRRYGKGGGGRRERRIFNGLMAKIFPNLMKIIIP